MHKISSQTNQDTTTSDKWAHAHQEGGRAISFLCRWLLLKPIITQPLVINDHMHVEKGEGCWDHVCECPYCMSFCIYNRSISPALLWSIQIGAIITTGLVKFRGSLTFDEVQISAPMECITQEKNFLIIDTSKRKKHVMHVPTNMKKWHRSIRPWANRSWDWSCH